MVSFGKLKVYFIVGDDDDDDDDDKICVSSENVFI